MVNTSNMDYFLADKTSDGVKDYVLYIQYRSSSRMLWPELCTKGQIWTTVSG
jgi:hypothetical protein